MPKTFFNKILATQEWIGKMNGEEKNIIIERKVSPIIAGYLSGSNPAIESWYLYGSYSNTMNFNHMSPQIVCAPH